MAQTVSPDSVAQDQIKAFVERIERLEEERKSIAADIAEVYAEAKGNGFDRKALKTVVRIRAMDHNDRMEHEALVELYLSALGMAAAPADDEDDNIVSFARAPAPARAHVETIEEFRATMSAEVEPDAALRPQMDPAAVPVGFASAEQASVESSAPFIGGENANSVGNADASHASLRSGGAEAARLAHNQEVAGASPAPATISNDDRAAEPEQPVVATTSSAGTEVDEDRQPIIEPAPAILPSPDGAGAVAASRSAVIPPAAPAAPVTRRPGETWTESTPPEPVHWHEYARCFPEHWGMALADIMDSVRAVGVLEPIIKIGDQILDGRARYNCARQLLIDYPVTEYDGADPLLDVIRWNVEARNMGANERKLVATKLIKLCPDRGEEISAAFGLETERAAAE